MKVSRNFRTFQNSRSILVVRPIFGMPPAPGVSFAEKDVFLILAIAESKYVLTLWYLLTQRHLQTFKDTEIKTQFKKSRHLHLNFDVIGV